MFTQLHFGTICINILVFATTPISASWSDKEYGEGVLFSWESSYTNSNLKNLACLARPDSTTLSASVDLSFPSGPAAGALGAISDHSQIWMGAHQCKNNTDPNKDPTCFEQTTCGFCFEVECDEYWDNAKRDHPNTCHKDKSVIIKVLDACPGVHKINEPKGTANWCKDTGVNHFDLYRPAFDHIANLDDGVIKMKFRQTDCSRVGYWYRDSNGKSQRYNYVPVGGGLPTSA
ncbi:RlpA-like double-psi beta-barrel-protein domain-containing protein-containing protein [Paraphysoderma sedebokerense]|nr:RlpA-like double-psi beta-barrel-protein domain-containing protein-containing protein [Paraphysoderma sedebokerense]